jgi:hypothetical protein
VTGTSLRIGATNLIVANPFCELVHAVIRGGWDYSGLCNIWEYIQACNQLLNVAARAIGAWKNPRSETYPPRLVPIRVDPATTIMIDNFISELFNACPQGKGLQQNG